MLKKEGIQEKEIEYIIRQEIKASDDKDWQGLDENLMGQVKMELADKVTDMLMQEAVDILNEIENSRRWEPDFNIYNEFYLKFKNGFQQFNFEKQNKYF